MDPTLNPGGDGAGDGHAPRGACRAVGRRPGSVRDRQAGGPCPLRPQRPEWVRATTSCAISLLRGPSSVRTVLVDGRIVYDGGRVAESTRAKRSRRRSAGEPIAHGSVSITHALADCPRRSPGLTRPLGFRDDRGRGVRDPRELLEAAYLRAASRGCPRPSTRPRRRDSALGVGDHAVGGGELAGLLAPNGPPKAARPLALGVRTSRGAPGWARAR